LAYIFTSYKIVPVNTGTVTSAEPSYTYY